MIRRVHIILAVLIMMLALAANAVAQNNAGRGNQANRGQSNRMQSARSQEGGCMGALQLTDAQRREMARIRQDTQQRVLNVRRDTSMTSTQRDQRIAQIQREGHDRVLSVLTTQQRQQFQSCWDNRGQQGMPGGAGAGPGMSRGADIGQGVPGVQLTQDQSRRIAQIRARTREQVQAVQRNNNLTQQQKADRIAEIRQQAHEDVINVLTPEQRQQFNDHWAGRQGTQAAPTSPGG